MSLAAPYPGTFLYRQAVENGWLDAEHAELVDEHGIQIAPLHYPHLSHTEIFDNVETFYQAVLFPRAEDRLDRRRDGAQPADDEAAAARGRGVLPVPAGAARGGVACRTTVSSGLAGETVIYGGRLTPRSSARRMGPVRLTRASTRSDRGGP